MAFGAVASGGDMGRRCVELVDCGDRGARPGAGDVDRGAGAVDDLVSHGCEGVAADRAQPDRPENSVVLDDRREFGVEGLAQMVEGSVNRRVQVALVGDTGDEFGELVRAPNA